jgi:hypothetical protein
MGLGVTDLIPGAAVLLLIQGALDALGIVQADGPVRGAQDADASFDAALDRRNELLVLDDAGARDQQKTK